MPGLPKKKTKKRREQSIDSFHRMTHFNND